MNKVGGKLVLWGLIVAMLVFTAIRTIHFLQLTFPPDQQYVAYLGLAAFDIGVLGWFYFATQSAEGTFQRVIAYGMIVVCAGGVLSTTIVDMTLVSGQNGLATIPKDMGTLGLWAVIIVISLDFLAGILAHLADPKHQKHFEMQNAKDVIHATTMEHIKQQAHTIAPQIAKQVSDYWATQVAAEMTGQIPGATQPLQLTPPPTVVHGTGVALPQTDEQPTQPQPSSTPVQPPVPLPDDFTPEQRAIYEQVLRAFVQQHLFPLPTLPKQRPPAPVPPIVQPPPGTPIQPSSFYENVERLYKQNPQAFDRLIENAAREVQQPQSPLQQPHLNPTGQVGETNGHQ